MMRFQLCAWASHAEVMRYASQKLHIVFPAYLMSVCRPCSSATISDSLQVSKGLSKVKAVTSHPLDLSILRHLDENRVGFAKASVHKQLRKARQGSASREANEGGGELVYPFFMKGRKQLSISGAWDDQAVQRLHDSPQLLLVGRSNAGKSSLLNALLGFNSTYVQRAAVSGRPG
ncbi:MAG: hypothetical protein EOO06_20730, partial [Chitinophagaceae bacterium]